MKSRMTVVLLVALLLLVVAYTAVWRHAASPAAAAMAGAATGPAGNFTLHVDAKRHFPGKASFIAHHWCRPAAGGITECQLYDSDAPNARLVGVEVIVPTATWKTYSKSEQALWHSHRVEIPKVDAVLPGMSAADAKKTLASLLDTYGKIYLLWDASVDNRPMGQPLVYVLK